MERITKWQSAFFETFPTLKLEQELKELLDLAEVLHINYTRNKSSILIYLRSPRLMQKETIYGLEEEITRQLFGNHGLRAIIIEQYALSSQYTPEKLFQVYKDSILLEFKRSSDLEYNLLRKAEWDFVGDNVLKITMEDSMWARDRSLDMKHQLDKVFGQRCGFDVDIRFDYTQTKQSRLRMEAEEREKREIQRVLSGRSSSQAVVSGAGANSEELPWDAEEQNQSMEPQKAVSSGAANLAAGSQAKGRQGTLNRKGSRNFQRKLVRSDNPNVIFGRDFEDNFIKIEEIVEEMGEVTIRGKVLDVITRELRNGEKTIVSFPVTDLTDTIMVKIFVPNENLPDLLEKLKKGSFVTVKGMSLVDKFDKEVAISSVVGIRKSEDFTSKRVDNAPVKRVELHCHTKASEMDAVTEVKDLINQAKAWGHQAMAVTDHGCAYAFPDALHALSKNDPFKVIYGVEGYLVDDQKECVVDPAGQSLDAVYVVFDIETTGFSPVKNKIIEIGAVKVEAGKIVDRFSTFVNPGEPIPFHIEHLTGIDDSMVVGCDPIEKVLPRFLDFCRGAVMVAHNASFDMSFIIHNAGELGVEFHPTYVDTVGLARFLLPRLNRYKLDTVAKELGVTLENHHRAVDDAEATAGIFQRLLERLKAQGMGTVDDVAKKAVLGPEAIKKLPTYHVIVLAANEVGRINLYRLISKSHIDYFARRPRMPKSELTKYREGLIIGSACESGELFQAVVRGESEADIAKIVSFYDYLEIQPIGNNMFMLEKEDSPQRRWQIWKIIIKKSWRWASNFTSRSAPPAMFIS